MHVVVPRRRRMEAEIKYVLEFINDQTGQVGTGMKDC